ncbi:MAG: carboxypeptidase-like regulatory domain-containing protein, partial [Defluviitaleaceae bacterium]|nr:carboxypeptidase-like regulatory domain-containing protein [Defluviitaleaceae bacterium]
MKRKIAFMVFVVMLFSAFAAPNVFAAVNDMGVVYYTDIRATVNGQFIPYISVSVNGNSGVGTVAITDLTNYGFDIAVDNNAKTATLTFNANKTVTPLPVVEVTGKSGNVAYRYFSTDWKVFVAGVRVDSYNVGSRLSIKFGDLAAYGTYDWNGTTRVSSFTTNVNSIPQPPTKFSVSGKIIDQATGLAISGASVSLYANGSVVPTQTTSNANGDYVIGNVNASSTCYVQVTSPGYADAKSASFAVNAANVTGMNVTMQRASNTTVIGYVGDQANNAIIRNATVIIKNSAGTQIGSATTDSTGYYTVAGIPAGVCSFTASASGYASNTVTSTVSGSTFRQDIKLTSSGYSINGTLNAGNTGLGNNLSNIQVALYKDSVSSSNFVTSVYTTDRNGTSLCPRLQNGAYYAVVAGAQIGLSSDSRSAAIVI